MDRPDDMLDELGRLWRAQQETDRTDPREVLMEIKKKARKFDRVLLWRDVREVAAGLLVAVAMGGSAWLVPGWLPKAGALFGIGCIAYVLFRLLAPRRRHARLRDDVSLADRLQAELRKVEAQAGLLRSIVSWYVLPLALGGTVWVVSLVPATDQSAAAVIGAMAAIAGASAAIFTAIGVVVTRLNRQAVTEQLDPYASELRRTLEQVRGGALDVS